MNLDKKNMSFWCIKLYNTETGQEEVLNVASGKTYTAKDVKRVLEQAHPEYRRMRARKTKKPEVWKT